MESLIFDPHPYHPALELKDCLAYGCRVSKKLEHRYGYREPGRWLASPSFLDRADRPVA